MRGCEVAFAESCKAGITITASMSSVETLTNSFLKLAITNSCCTQPGVAAAALADFDPSSQGCARSYLDTAAVKSPSTPNCSTLTAPESLAAAESIVPLYFTVSGVPSYSES